MKKCTNCIHFHVCNEHCNSVRYNGGGCHSCTLEVCGAGVCDNYEEEVKIVHCKDCKHYHKVGETGGKNNGTWGQCRALGTTWKSLYPDDFCSYGERKEC